MIEVLKKIEQDELIDLLQIPEIWNSLEIDYHPPRVERIWCQVGDYRIYLHHIYPCQREEALYHTHPWPSAMHILSGEYEMGLGYPKLLGIAEIDEIAKKTGQRQSYRPETIATTILPAGTYYEMLNPKGYHYVRPLSVCQTIMITGQPFENPVGVFKSDKVLENLSLKRKEEIRLDFLKYYLLK